MYKAVIILLVIIFNIFQTIAGNDIKNENNNLYTERNRLINNTATNIFKDKNGFIWIGSEVGLSRYDGSNFHNFQIIKSGLADIIDILETDNDILWILTKQGKLAGFDKHREMFIDLVSININMPENFKSIYAHQNGIYGLSNRKLYLITTKKEKEKVKVEISTPYIIEDAIIDLYGTNNKLILKTLNDNLYIHNLINKKTSCIDLNKIGLTKAKINDIAITRNYIWICNNITGLTCCDIQTQEVKNFNFKQEKNSKLGNSIRQIIPIDDTRFIYHNDKNIYQLDFNYNNYLLAPLLIKEVIESYDNRATNTILDTYYDNQLNILWIASVKGIGKINLYNRDIHTIDLNDEVGQINGIAQDSQGYIWLSTDKAGIYKSTEKEISSNLKFAEWSKIAFDGATTMHKDKHGNLLVGDESGKVYHINSMTNETQEIKILPPQLSGEISPIVTLYLNSKNELWVITEKGIAVCNWGNKNNTTYSPFASLSEKCTVIAEDGEGTIWVGTESGIKNAKIDNGNIILEGNYELDHKLTPEKVLSIYVNPYNRVYVSYPNKFLQIDGSNKKIISQNILYQDFPYGQIYSIIDDKRGTLWLGSNSGIITLRNKDAQVNTYPISGNKMSVTQLNDGSLLWANTHTKLIYFDPGKLKSQTVKENILVSDIDINYERAEIGRKINEQTILTLPAYQTKNLTLNSKNNSIVIYLTDLQYNNLQRKISYRVLPNDTVWQNTYSYKIYLNRLEAGNHTLEIKQLTDDFKEEACPILNIKVDNDSGISFWVILIVLFIVGALVYIYYPYSKNKISNKANAILKNKKNLEVVETIEAIQQEKEQKFYDSPNYAQIITNYGINNFLSSINDYLKEIVKNKNLPENIIRKGKLALRNMINVKDACAQLIDIYNPTIYDSTLKINEYTINEINCQVKKHFKELLNNSPITLLTEGDQMDAKIWVDREKIEFILRNMLNNSFRRIAYVGKVWFSVKQISFNENNYYVFTISDKGKHLSQEIDSKSCEKNNNLEIEIGMPLMDILAKQHHGEIKLIGDETSGTQISLFILTGKEHFNNDPNVVFINQKQLLGENKEIVTAIKKPTKEKDYINEKILTVQEKTKTVNIETIDKDDSTMSTEKPKLLIIEDHKDNRFYLKVLFANEYTLFLAENGKEGLDIALKEIPDIIIADVMMPVMDGFECCKRIKEDLRTCHIPVILLTALIEDEEVVRGIENGADDYILKPFNPEILKTKARRLVKSRSDLKQIYKKLLIPQQGLNETSNNTTNTEQVENPFIAQIINIVSDNLQNPEFNVKKLSEMLNMSQPTLYRKVKQLTNFTIIELIRGVRLKHSAELLRNKTYNVQEVAEMVGYNDIPTFRKHFIDLYGVTPSAYTKE